MAKEVESLYPVQWKQNNKKGGKSWVVDLRGITPIPGKPLPRFDSKQEALIFIENLKNNHGKMSSSRIHWTMKRFKDHWFKTEIKNYEREVADRPGKIRHINHILGMKVDKTLIANILVRDIDTAMLQKYVVNPLCQGRTKKTVISFISHLSLFFGEAIIEGCRKENPCKEALFKINCAKQSKPKETVEKILPHVIAKVIEAAPNLYWKSAIQFAAGTGARQGEQRAITWGDFNLMANDIPKARISKSVITEKWQDGKGQGRCMWKIEKLTKADRLRKDAAGKRFLPLQSGLVQTLKEYKLACGNPNDEQLVWGSPTGYIKNDNAFRETLALSIKKANVSKFHWHMLRHHYASVLIHQGLSEDSICKKMGHADITTTRRTYGHWFESKEKELEEMQLIEKGFDLTNPIKVAVNQDQHFAAE